MALMSFNASPFYQLPFAFSTRWYADLWANAEIRAAALRSLVIAATTTAIATALGCAAALALFRYAFRGKALLQALLFPPIAIPWLITGTAMLIFFFGVGLGRGAPAVLIGHVALALPYVVIVVNARLASFDPTLEEAARSLGASPWMVARRVTLPWMAPGVVAGALFAFAVSFDQFVVSYFLARPGDATLPVLIYTSIRKGFTPEINAVSTIVIGVSMAALLAAARFSNFGGRR
ncbi:MAG: ABC transporter permease [Rhodobacteraceae bacterium]|nr:MAG: ABC transporter permease [Paracoccaceae bacterium]